MSGQSRIVVSEMSRPKTPKGSALKSALDTSAFEEKILEVNGDDKQPIKK